ncbi:MAG: sulfite exporter TauE/SafE family protein [Clostridiales bacterium]|nr:sulfite exporter TauE/SafE family protein [Clostridiales bacterium]
MDKTSKTKKQGLSPAKEGWLSVLTGVVTGFINGLFGGGGGMIVVPMLTYLLKRSPKTAHATAILIILPLSLVSGLIYLAFGNFKWEIGLPVGIGVTVGGIVGAFLLKKLSAKWVTIIFAVMMAIAGGKMLFF